MGAAARLRLIADLQRKDPRLPVFVVIPGSLLAPWRLAATSIVEGTANGHAFGRRTLKAWGKGSDDWFIEFTAPFCKTSALQPGDRFVLELALADMSMPEELQRALRADQRLEAAWLSLSASEQRQAGEHVRAARSEAARERRAASICRKLRGELPASQPVSPGSRA